VLIRGQMDFSTGESKKSAQSAATEDSKSDLTDDDPVNARVLTLVNDLGFTILTKSRASELHG